MKRRADVTLALSVLLYAITWEFDLYLPAYPNGVWAFNPFAWQLLFVFGAWCALGGAKRMARILSSRITLWICIAYLCSRFCVTLTWHVPQLNFLMPRWLESGCIRSTRPISMCCGSPISWRWRRLPCASCRRTGRA